MLDNMKDKTFLLICTVKYCLGRQSYAVGWIRDLLKRHWKKIPKNDRKTILEDIKNHRHDRGFCAIDEELWDEILDLGYKDKLIVERKNGKYK